MSIIKAFSLCFFLIFTNVSSAQSCGSLPERNAGERYVFVISDLHLGLGKDRDNKWHAVEDFRWDNALKSFLDTIARCGENSVDLVIAGDFLELWQLPPGIECKGSSSSFGCRPDEALSLVKVVTMAHAGILREIGSFADTGENRVFVVPGNHDAALLIPEVWGELKKALSSRKEAVKLVSEGVWLSREGRIVVEHGHQIGADVNRYAQWPEVLKRDKAQSYLERPWGEQFVQKLFNSQEVMYPTIDNLSPESTGARYRMSDRGLWGSAADMASFIRFNIFETSAAQKSEVLSLTKSSGEIEWNRSKARKNGVLLFARALPEDDAFRKELQGQTLDAIRLQRHLATVARSLPDEEVDNLCNTIHLNKRGDDICRDETLSAVAQNLLFSNGGIIGSHLKLRMATKKYSGMTVFIYGHTHLLEEEWTVTLTPQDVIKVFNTGAFQRVVDEDGFLKRARDRKISPAQALKQLSVEDLAPCYTAVVSVSGPVFPSTKTLRWVMDEDGKGEFDAPTSQACK